MLVGLLVTSNECDAKQRMPNDRSAPSYTDGVRCRVAVGRRGPPPLAAGSFDPGKADFTIAYNNEVSSFRAAAAVVLPGATMTLQVTAGPAGEYTMTAKTGAVNRTRLGSGGGARRWSQGLYDLRFEGSKAADAIHLHVFVMVPASAVRDGMLNGYRIGQYPGQAAERVTRPIARRRDSSR